MTEALARVPVERARDRALASLCVAGDAMAQRELFHRERRRVHAIVYRMMGTNVGIDDLVQDAFIAIFRSLREYRGEAALGTWIDRCTVRVALQALRAGRRRPTVALVHDVPAREPSAEQRALHREAARRIYAVLERLDPKPRAAYVLHVIDGRPAPEVATLMEASLVATKARIWRARRVVESAARRDPVLRDYLLDGSPAATADEEEACDESA
jgi:RNA polymerase sigma-70 factor (ECF subfamily)